MRYSEINLSLGFILEEIDYYFARIGLTLTLE